MSLFEGLEISEKIQLVAILLILSMTLKNIFIFLGVFVGAKLQVETIKYFQMRCFDQLIKVGMEYFNSRKGGDFHTITANHTQSIGGIVAALPELAVKLTTILVYVVMIIILSWEMTLIAVVLASFCSLLLNKLMTKAHRIGKNHTREFYNLNNASLELISGMKLIRYFGRETRVMDFLSNRLNEYSKARFNNTIIYGIVRPLFEVCAIISLGAILIYSSYGMFQSGKIGIPTLITFLAIFQRMSAAAMHLNQFRVNYASNWAACNEVFQFLIDDDKEHLINGNKKIEFMQKELLFRNINFKYKTRKDKAINNISFSIKKGKKIGICGISGSGKSTITELLLRFYEPQGGEILLDGLNIKQLDVYAWRRCIGLVSQDVYLINDTIRNNISYGKHNATQDEIETVASKARAHEFIQELPQKYETIVGDRGVLLSGGQKQRIAIARAILIDPEILIFDEATSALDTESEKIVQQALDEVGEGRTVITIAHRLSTIFDSDRIFVINCGGIIEEGTHQELIQKGGTYKKLVQMQEY